MEEKKVKFYINDNLVTMDEKKYAKLKEDFEAGGMFIDEEGIVHYKVVLPTLEEIKKEIANPTIPRVYWSDIEKELIHVKIGEIEKDEITVSEAAELFKDNELIMKRLQDLLDSREVDLDMYYREKIYGNIGLNSEYITITENEHYVPWKEIEKAREENKNNPNYPSVYWISDGLLRVKIGEIEKNGITVSEARELFKDNELFMKELQFLLNNYGPTYTIGEEGARRYNEQLAYEYTTQDPTLSSTFAPSTEKEADDMLERMAVGEDVLGEGEQVTNTNNKQMGYTVPWLLGLATGALITTIAVLAIKMLA